MVQEPEGDVVYRYFLSTTLTATRNICAILVEGIMRNISVDFCLAERNHLCNFGREHCGEHSYVTIFILDK